MKSYFDYGVKVLQVLLLVFFLSSFSNNKNNVKLIEAKSERWTSGMRNGGSSTEYYFKIQILSNHKITFDQLWINNKALKTYLATNHTAISSQPITFKKNDTIILRATENSKENNVTARPPIAYKGEGLLRYFVKGKPFFLTINAIKKIHSPNRP